MMGIPVPARPPPTPPVPTGLPPILPVLNSEGHAYESHQILAM